MCSYFYAVFCVPKKFLRVQNTFSYCGDFGVTCTYKEKQSILGSSFGINNAIHPKSEYILRYFSILLYPLQKEKNNGEEGSDFCCCGNGCWSGGTKSCPYRRVLVDVGRSIYQVCKSIYERRLCD